MSYQKAIFKEIQECNKREKLLKDSLSLISDSNKKNILLMQLEENRMFCYRLISTVWYSNSFEKFSVEDVS